MTRRPGPRADRENPSVVLRAVPDTAGSLNPTDVEFVPTLLIGATRPDLDDTDPLTELIANELANAHELARLALAAETMTNYRRAWRQFNEFCLAHGSASLPAPNDIVALYLATSVVQTDESGRAVRNDDREMLPGRLSPGAMSIQCAAIDRAHEVAGYRRPSKAPEVRAVIRGIRRTFGVRAADPKTPLELDGLQALLSACSRGEAKRLRDRAVVLLAHYGVTPTRMAGLGVRHVTRTATGLWIGEPQRGRPFVVLEPSTDARCCPVAAVQNLLAVLPSDGPLVAREVSDAALARLTGPPHPLTRQAITNLIRRRAAAAGVELPATGVPSFDDQQVAATIDEIGEPMMVDVRDRSLLLTGWSAALRQSNLRRLLWRDFAESMGDIEVLLTRDKNDPLGQGRSVWLPRGTSRATCPVTAWQEWRARVGEAIGGDPMRVARDQPCYVPLDRHGNLLRTESGRLARLSKGGVNDIVKALCARAGLDPARFGSHSLRAGFITEASKRGETATAIQQVTGHKSLEMVSRYTRPMDSRAFAPSRRMGL